MKLFRVQKLKLRQVVLKQPTRQEPVQHTAEAGGQDKVYAAERLGILGWSVLSPAALPVLVYTVRSWFFLRTHDTEI